MVKPRIIVVDPSGEGRAAVSSVLRFRRWSGSEMDPFDVADMPEDVDVVLAVENARGEGAIALRQVRRSGCQAARILLCDARTAAQVVARGEPAHQVVVRPASGEKVLSAVKRSLRVRDLLRDPNVRAVASSFSSLPAMPDTWLRLNELLESETATMQDAVTLVERDVGLSAKVLQLVSSGLFGLERPMGSLFAALQRLGLAVVRDLVLSVELFEDLDAEDLSDVFGPLPMSRTSHLVAMAARRVAPRAAIDSAFSAGLFHQLGRMVFAAQAPGLFRKALERPSGAGLGAGCAARALCLPGVAAGRGGLDRAEDGAADHPGEPVRARPLGPGRVAGRLAGRDRRAREAIGR